MAKDRHADKPRILCEYEIRFLVTVRDDSKTLVLVEGVSDEALSEKLCKAVMDTLKAQPAYKP